MTSAGRSIRLHDLLATPGVHILLDRDADRLGPLPTGPLVKVHRLASVPGRGLIAVRPDGYVGFRCQATEAIQLTTWLTRLGAWQPQTSAGPPANGRTSRITGLQGRRGHRDEGPAACC